MTSCDTNILFHRCRPSDPLFPAAEAFLSEMGNREDFAICELVLVELYTLLRNPAVVERPLAADEAVQVIQGIRSHPRWKIVDYPGGLMNDVWMHARRSPFARRRIYDTRLALALRFHGVKEFATRNMADFQGFGFRKVWDPCT